MIIPDRQKFKIKNYSEQLKDEIKLDMVLIPGGCFWMGTTEENVAKLSQSYQIRYNFQAETPQHQVQVPTFWMARYPVTQQQWSIVANWETIKRPLDPDPSYFKHDYQSIERGQRPVDSVSWEDVQEFCRRLSRKTQKKYRLPTEAEWEYACRGVSSQQLTIEEWNQKYDKPFYFGDTISTELANYNGNYTFGNSLVGEDRNQTTPVGYFKIANDFGLEELHGNVWEWCEDDYHENYQDAPVDGSAWLSGGSSVKVLRGGSCFLSPRYCRSACRAWDTSTDRGSSFGFRVVLDFSAIK